jgi:predicted ATPase
MGLDDFQILVGPNASGKTTFLDVVQFLGDIVSGGLEKTISKRTQNFQDLIWKCRGQKFELAVEFQLPEGVRKKLEKAEYPIARYELAIGMAEKNGELGIRAERLLLTNEGTDSEKAKQRSLFPEGRKIPDTILTPKMASGKKTIVKKVIGGNDNFYDETGRGWDHAFKLGPRKSALANLPEDETRFPASTWVKGVLTDSIQNLVLNSLQMRRPSPPGQPKRFQADGSNLPWVIERLREKHPEHYRNWVRHIQSALPDIVDVKTVLRPEDRNRYIMLEYKGGLNVPSWTASDGTLRLLALTLPAYLPEMEGIFLIEEPENGIHPRALECIFYSLTSVYNAQVLMATHSPVMVGLAEPEQILCFGKLKDGSVDIVRGDAHPKLERWQKETNIGELFAAGVFAF